MSMEKMIKDYVDAVLDFDVSPFESIEGFHIRDRIQERIDHLSEDEK